MRSLVDSVSGAFERLSGREQAMLLFVIVGLGGLVLFLSTWTIQKDLKARAVRIEAKTKDLKQLGELKGDYSRRLEAQNRLADQVRKNNKLRLLSYIEDVSKEAQIDLANATERQGEATGALLKEEAAELTIKDVAIDRLYDFLDRIEKGNRLVRVRKLKIKRRYDNPKRLDATVTIGTFKLAEEAT